MKRLALPLLLCLSLPALASAPWTGPDGQPLPDTSASHSKRGFSAARVITADRDWLAGKWAVKVAPRDGGRRVALPLASSFMRVDPPYEDAGQ